MQINLLRVHAWLLLVMMVLGGAGTAWAVTPFTVRDIRIEGLQRVEPGTVFVSIPVQVGEVYSDEKGSAAIRALFALGLFKDVRIEVNGDVLVLIVEERPTLGAVDFVGTKEFDKDVLRKALRDVGLADGRPFDKAQLDRAEQELKRQYINRSLYAAEVVTTVTPTERNRVNLTFTVNEGDTAKISEIRLVGNKVFSESTLRSLFDLDTGGWLSWYTKSNRYSRAKLNADIETLRSYYLTRGYLEFKLESTQVSILPNKTDIAITINIVEGERFDVSSVKLEGNFLGRDDEFKSLVTIRLGQPYNADDVAKTSKAFTDYFANFGFAFARVEARSDIDRASNRVVITLQADPSRRAYVRKINIAGNSRSRDVVVRRELRQFEASWYDGYKIKLSRDRVDRLGYFGSVLVDTQEVPGSPDQVDLTFEVVEKPTGSLSLGAGFSSGDGLGLSFAIKQDNAFGSGNSLGIQLNTSKINRVYFGAGVENTSIVPGTSLPTSYLDYANLFGYDSSAVPLTLGWSRDRRDSSLAPNSGRLQRANAEWSVAGDARYFRTTYQYQEYFPLNKQFTVAVNGEAGFGVAVGERAYPVFKNYYGGGLGSVRGFEQGSLGPRDANGAVIGGTRKVNLNAELLTPFPGAGNDRTPRLYGFVDVGSIAGPDGGLASNATANDLRSSTGVGISWISPVGPLRLAFSWPVKNYDGDKMQSVQFQIGSSF